MNTLQRLFDRLVGIAYADADRRHQAHQIFSVPNIRPEDLERPACWRRQSRIQSRRLP